MRILVIMRGAPGCGKSTFIRKHQLEPYTLCPDDIRLMHHGIVLSSEGREIVSLEKEKSTWKLLYELLEQRMADGIFTVIDATASTSSEIKRYKKLAEEYRYRVLLVDMSNVPIEQAKKQNEMRLNGEQYYKYVPEHVIDRMYKRFDTQAVPGGIQIVSTDTYQEEIEKLYAPRDFSNYKKIHHIGDIHGCYDVLMEYFDTYSNGVIKEDELYIFCGDYLDRGIQNKEVMKWILQNYQRPNLLFLEGNHEQWILHYANDDIHKIRNRGFKTDTMKDLESFSRKELKGFCKSLLQLASYTYGDKTVLVDHGGISKVLDKDIYKVPTYQLIKGVGNYEEMIEVCTAFENDQNIYQIFGHRNIQKSDIQVNTSCFCLEGEVEFGGHLRAVVLDESGFDCIEVKNNVFGMTSLPTTRDNNNFDLSSGGIVDELRKSKFIRENVFDNDISAFNFTREAFTKQKWNALTMKARGLFINTKTNEVVMRGYEKFMNTGEVSETRLSTLEKKLIFPLTLYHKYNGYLGLVSYLDATDDLIVGTKGSLDGDFAVEFKKILYSGMYDVEFIKKYTKEHNCTLVFEVIAPPFDTHMIEYDKPELILLDCIYNKLEFERQDNNQGKACAKGIGCRFKEVCFVFDDFASFKEFHDRVIDDKEYKFDGEYIEGFVCEDASGFMFKMKLAYYKYWKRMRGAKDTWLRHKKAPKNLDEDARSFFLFIAELDDEVLEEDIISLRKRYLEHIKTVN
ncbi:RNA ligase [Breznakia pachnodae]|uniref:Kinase n=1 Tax=Breznakia pachnodae TaxID=265178 RepID=A0ABU0E177_9FIRM|nr:RNA ligase [Breznakia pachnodae]MDQ0360633.1 putative kinase [Breznakia pachnodae]